jgi:hypothetical protein
MVRTQSRFALLVQLPLLLVASAAHAEETQVPPALADSLPGSEIPPGPGLSPQAPPVPPAAGGRAPSFGAPTEKSAATFRIGGRIFGYEAVGIGEKPSNTSAGYSGTALHSPMLSAGKIPFWGGSGATLNLSYGTPSLSAYVTYYFRLNGQEYQGSYTPQAGPGVGVAYLQAIPDPIGALHLKFKAGDFIEIYGGPGQWGWGVFGPLLALRGYGETSVGDWDVSRDWHITLTQGLLVVPGVPEDFPRGDYNGWIETGVSSWVHHAHVGLDYKNQYNFRLHYASDHGADERTHLLNSLNSKTCVAFEANSTTVKCSPSHPDGRFDAYIGEFGWTGNPWGHIGASAALYDFHSAASVSDGIWWAVDWSQGAKDMVSKYLGPHSNGNGKVLVLSAEYDFSVSPFLWYPRSFTGNAPDIRVALAAMITRTIASDDPLYKDSMGYFFGVESEYRMTSLFSLTLKTYGENRNGNMMIPVIDAGSGQQTAPLSQRWAVYSINPGISYHAKWMSLDRIELLYGRRFYSSAVDNNSAKPLDRNMITVGGYLTF